MKRKIDEVIKFLSDESCQNVSKEEAAYIISIIGEPIIKKKLQEMYYAMAQIDHFYPRDNFPIFAVSLYNLVPLCGSCNHIKSTKEIGISPHDQSHDFSQMNISYRPMSGNWINDAEQIEIQFQYDTDN